MAVNVFEQAIGIASREAKKDRKRLIIRAIVSIAFWAGTITLTVYWFDWKMVIVLLLFGTAHNFHFHLPDRKKAF